jgi:hypothetical protein
VARGSFRPKPHRIERKRIALRERVIAEHPRWDPERVEAEADSRLAAELAPEHPLAPAEYERLRPTSLAPLRAEIDHLVEMAAIRSLPEAQELEALLGDYAGGSPRAGNHRLPLAVFFEMAVAPGRPVIDWARKAFLGCDPLRRWAYDVEEADLRTRSALYETLKAMLLRHDPEVTLELNIRALRRLAQLGHNVGYLGVVDGTDFPACREQRAPRSQAEREHIQRGLSADFGYHHGGDGVFGWTALILWDGATGLPVTWCTFPRNLHEHEWVGHLYDTLADLHALDLSPEIIVGDSEFDVTQVCFDLVFRRASQPIFDRHGTIGREWPHWATEGVPECSRHGLMKLEQSEDFLTKAELVRMGRPRLGELARSETNARLRWLCPVAGCGARETTRPRDNARLNTYYPAQGQHRRVATRAAAFALRNLAESGNAALKGRGIAGAGVEVARWVSDDRQQEWLLGAGLLGQTLRRLAHESGAYAQKLEEAVRLGLIAECVVNGYAGRWRTAA